MTGVRGAAVVIEDDADIRFLLEVTLGQAGFAVTSAATGREGVAAVREQQPVVTTLDISLPDYDGFEVARRIRAFSDTYILMLTGRADEIDTLMGLDAGADDYVTKPFRPREVRARVEAMLRRPRALSPPAVGRPRRRRPRSRRTSSSTTTCGWTAPRGWSSSRVVAWSSPAASSTSSPRSSPARAGC